MKSVNFWLPPNLIKHVDEAFRGTAGSQEKRDLGSGDQGTGSVGARDPWRGDGWGHCDVSSVCACVCVSSTNGEQCSWDFFHLVTVCQVILQEAGRCSGLFCRSVSGHMITWFLPAAEGKLLLLICLMKWMIFVIKWVSLIEACLYCRDQIIMVCITLGAARVSIFSNSKVKLYSHSNVCVLTHL